MIWRGGLEHEVDEHQIGHGPATAGRGAHRGAGEAELGDRRVDHPVAAEFVPQILGVGKAAAAFAGPLAHVDGVRIAAHFLGDPVADRFQISLHDGFGVGIGAGQVGMQRLGPNVIVGLGRIGMRGTGVKTRSTLATTLSTASSMRGQILLRSPGPRPTAAA